MEERVRIPRVSLRGEPRELGRQHGEELRERVAQAVELYRVWFRDVGKLEWSQVLEHAHVYGRVVEREAPDLFEEMQGIAEGADVTPGAVVALNCRTELGYGASGALSEAAQRLELSECTAAGINSDGAADNRVYVGQNWDWRHTHLPITVILSIDKPDTPNLHTLTEAGMVGKLGINEARVALCFNLLATSKNQVGMAAHVLARQVLEQRRLGRALDVVAHAQRAGAGNFLLGHYDDEEGIGEVVNVQWAATDFNVEFPNRGFIARSNHFVRPIRGAEDRIKFDEEAGMNTFIRLERANRILGRFANRGRLGRRALEAVFQDHYNRPNSICAHAVEKEDHLRQSNSSIIMDLVAPSLSYTEGPPCTTTYHTIQL